MPSRHVCIRTQPDQYKNEQELEHDGVVYKKKLAKRGWEYGLRRVSIALSVHGGFFHRIEVWMVLGLRRREPLLVVITEQFVQEVNSLI